MRPNLASRRAASLCSSSDDMSSLDDGQYSEDLLSDTDDNEQKSATVFCLTDEE